jgi:GNAT superfamily N-acetyltransferase
VNGRGLGRALLAEALRIALRVADEVGCRGIVADAYPAKLGWYARFGFVLLDEAAGPGPKKMFLDVRTIRRAISRDSAPFNETQQTET